MDCFQNSLALKSDYAEARLWWDKTAPRVDVPVSARDSEDEGDDDDEYAHQQRAAGYGGDGDGDGDGSDGGGDAGSSDNDAADGRVVTSSEARRVV